MAENTTQVTEGTNQSASAEQTGEKTFTQAEVDKLISERLKRERSKYEGFDDIKAKAAKADSWADYDDVKAERDRLTAEIAHRDLLDKVVAETGIPRGLVHGDTEEEMRASAQAVAAYVETLKPQHPTDKGGAASPKPTTRESILAIKDEDARRRAIAENIELFG